MTRSPRARTEVPPVKVAVQPTPSRLAATGNVAPASPPAAYPHSSRCPRSRVCSEKISGGEYQPEEEGEMP